MFLKCANQERGFPITKLEIQVKLHKFRKIRLRWPHSSCFLSQCPAQNHILLTRAGGIIRGSFRGIQEFASLNALYGSTTRVFLRTVANVS